MTEKHVGIAIADHAAFVRAAIPASSFTTKVRKVENAKEQRQIGNVVWAFAISHFPSFVIEKPRIVHYSQVLFVAGRFQVHCHPKVVSGETHS